MFTDDLHLVSNTYPVFEKLIYDNEKGIYLCDEFKKIKKANNPNKIQYFEEFNLLLKKFTADCYNKSKQYYVDGDETSADLRYYKSDNELYIYTLKLPRRILLLNYDQFDDVEKIHLPLIPKISDYDIHVKVFRQNWINYIVTNTYDSFINFTKSNNFPGNLESIDLFYDRFIEKIREVDLRTNIGKERIVLDKERSKRNRYNNYFNYVVVKKDEKNYIFILDYESIVLRLKNS